LLCAFYFNASDALQYFHCLNRRFDFAADQRSCTIITNGLLKNRRATPFSRERGIFFAALLQVKKNLDWRTWFL